MSVPQGKVPIVECVREGFRFLARDWREILCIALIGAAILTPVVVWTEVGQAQSNALIQLSGSVAATVVQIPILAAFLRRSLSRGGEPLSIRFGRQEMSLLGASIASGFFYLIVIVVSFFLLMMIFVALAMGGGLSPESIQGAEPEEVLRQFSAALGPEAKAVSITLLVGAGLFVLWLAARLSLVSPASVAEGRVLVFSTWDWTAGNGLRIMAVMCAMVLLATLVSLGVLAVPLGLLRGVFGDALSNPTAVPHIVATWVSQAVSLTLITAPYAAMSAHLYRGLRPHA